MEKQMQKKTKRRRTTFSFSAPEAGKVSLVGEFNNWDPSKHPMKCDDNGLWTKTVMLEPGIYEYKFLADENWMLDTKNEDSHRNCYGSFNSVITVSPWQK
jgi:5'-AMP-activated protein kinase regulatory beta subunit